MAEENLQSHQAFSDLFRDVFSTVAENKTKTADGIALFPGGLSYIELGFKILPSVDIKLILSGEKPKPTTALKAEPLSYIEAFSTDISKVIFTPYGGGGDIVSWIDGACAACGIVPNKDWQKGMHTLCERESSIKPNSVNTGDSNANGPIVADGHPQNCSRGLAQCIPTTFAAHHSDGTTWEIYDPVANIAAAINYIIARYRVAQDGSDLASKVQQADPNRPPKGYFTE